MIPMSCTVCARHPKKRKDWGCDEPTQRVEQDQKLYDDDGNILEYYSCPMLFIPTSVGSFLSKYHSIKNGSSLGVTYEEQDAKYMQSVEYYEYWYNECMNKKVNL